MFLHYILSQKEDSLMKKFFYAQIENSSKTDWTSQVERDCQELKITLNHEEIKAMSKNMFKNYVTNQVESGALNYLKSMIKSKGQEIKYTHIEMQDY